MKVAVFEYNKSSILKVELKSEEDLQLSQQVGINIIKKIYISKRYNIEEN